VKVEIWDMEMGAKGILELVVNYENFFSTPLAECVCVCVAKEILVGVCVVTSSTSVCLTPKQPKPPNSPKNST